MVLPCQRVALPAEGQCDPISHKIYNSCRCPTIRNEERWVKMCTPSLNRTEVNVDLKSAPVSIGVARRHVRMATMRSEARPHDLPTIKAEQRIEVSVIVENGLKCALTAT